MGGISIKLTTVFTMRTRIADFQNRGVKGQGHAVTAIETL